ncbi:hypothetical protein GDO81_018433 [Engystomops pustulosus]|uniref:Uncharacterized protein n=1 Tax=Engystomops pustulosus TaxID=76066 RepID=A0AAV6ZUZ8_ENGPU|nr:hypothetical protein GDO81_018433 [Engystomops pustulosus]
MVCEPKHLYLLKRSRTDHGTCDPEPKPGPDDNRAMLSAPSFISLKNKYNTQPTIHTILYRIHTMLSTNIVSNLYVMSHICYPI